MIEIFISYGEILDKLSILEIKMANINDAEKLKNISTELTMLKEKSKILLDNQNIQKMYETLKQVNQQLWDIENNIRLKEKEKKFDDDFIALARLVYFTNDNRAKIKKEINNILKSDIIEEKSYERY